jgi:predicted AlkP superfamily phosphohydrolase/phosphomutase
VTRPLFLIGLDGASFDVLEPLRAAGELPVLADLIARGATRTLASVVPPITPAAWSSFLTGKTPGRHGIYDFRLYDPRTGEDSFVTSRALRDATLWELLVAAGRRVAVVNLPMMYPPHPPGATIVSGFDTPSREAAFTLPPELRARILARHPDYGFVAVPDPADQNLETDAGFDTFLGRVERSIDQRTAVAADLLADGRWDAFMVHYQDTDALQHLAWRFLVDPGAAPARAERVRGVYRRLDAQLGTLLGMAPPDALVVVLSDHGFGAHTGRVYPNVLLRRWGYLSWRGRRRDKLMRSVRKRLARFGLATRARGPESAWEVRVRTQGFRDALPLRWRRTRAYVAVAEIYGLLYLNVRGRDRDGIIAAASARAVADEVRGRFLAVRDPDDGAPVFASVLHGADVYPDDPSGRRPDLILVPRPGFTVRRDLLHKHWLDHYRVTAGTHRPDGVLIVAGPGVRPGRLDAAAAIVDVAPTLLAAAGVPVPDDMDGRVLADLFVDPPAVTYARATERTGGDDGTLSDAEESQVTERLRALGYLA